MGPYPSLFMFRPSTPDPQPTSLPIVPQDMEPTGLAPLLPSGLDSGADHAGRIEGIVTGNETPSRPGTDGAAVPPAHADEVAKERHLEVCSSEFCSPSSTKCKSRDLQRAALPSLSGAGKRPTFTRCQMCRSLTASRSATSLDRSSRDASRRFLSWRVTIRGFSPDRGWLRYCGACTTDSPQAYPPSESLMACAPV